MSDLSREALLNARLRHRRPGRRFLTDESVRWGELVLPAPEEIADRPAGALRLATFCSFPIGHLVLHAAEFLARTCPELVSIVGVVTDDPINTDARIGMKQRFWRYIPQPRHIDLETAMVEGALQFGVPVFTGDTKSEWFHDQLRNWDIDAVLVCGFGQLIDPVVLATAKLGVNNMHPSDLASGIGIGPSPHEEVQARGDRTTAWSVHLMDEAFDTGPVLGTSAPINVCRADGSQFVNPMEYYNKILGGLDFLAVSVVSHLAAARAGGASEPLCAIDIAQVLPRCVQETMMTPINPGAPDLLRPLPNTDVIGTWLPELHRTLGL